MKLMFVLLAFLTMATLVTAMACANGETTGRLTGYAVTLAFGAVLGLLLRNQRKRSSGKRAAR
ncbi:hypothetical protein [Paraburkholderia sediminicola]|uniref:hypothetical protein n=1 Tax=Paraburkholderia sediminicola TaxID=458836 RepID=UPI0038B92A3A